MCLSMAFKELGVVDASQLGESPAVAGCHQHLWLVLLELSESCAVLLLPDVPAVLQVKDLILVYPKVQLLSQDSRW